MVILNPKEEGIMKLYVTYGTEEYLKQIQTRHNESNILLLTSEGQSILIHETDENSIFKEGKEFAVLDKKGEIEDGNFIIMNHVPVREEGRPVFENRFSNRPGLVEEMDGFQAIRVLRPLSDDTYIILTSWDNAQAYENWQESRQYAETHKKRGTTEGIDHQKQIFSGSSYVKSYTIVKD